MVIRKLDHVSWDKVYLFKNIQYIYIAVNGWLWLSEEQCILLLENNKFLNMFDLPLEILERVNTKRLSFLTMSLMFKDM